MVLQDHRRSVSPTKAEGDSSILGVKIPGEWRRQTCKNSLVSQALYHACVGIAHGVTHERIFRVHVGLVVLSIVLGVASHFELWHWLTVALSLGLIVAMELVNTAVERVVDLVTGQTYHRLAQEAKDVAAGAVFFSIVLSMTVLGVCVLGQWHVWPFRP